MASSNILTKIFGSRNERMLKNYRKIVEGINALDQKMAIHGNAASSTVRQIAGSLGTAVLMMLISLYTANSTSVSSLTTGYHAAFILAIVMSALGFILSFWLKQKKSIKQSN